MRTLHKVKYKFLFLLIFIYWADKISLEHSGPVLVVANPYRGSQDNEVFLKHQYNDANRYDFNGEQYEIICVSNRPPGHHTNDMKFYGHNCIHAYDDMKCLGHCFPIGEKFPDAENDQYKRHNVRLVYLRKL